MTVRQIRIQYLLAPAKLFIHNDFFFLLLFCWALALVSKVCFSFQFCFYCLKMCVVYINFTFSFRVFLKLLLFGRHMSGIGLAKSLQILQLKKPPKKQKTC